MNHMEEIIDQLTQILCRDTKIQRVQHQWQHAADSVAGKAMLKTMSLHIGDRILVDKCKPATLR